jgi:hypothetical protein
MYRVAPVNDKCIINSIDYESIKTITRIKVTKFHFSKENSVAQDANNYSYFILCTSNLWTYFVIIVVTVGLNCVLLPS